jgi:hypothetical protein
MNNIRHAAEKQMTSESYDPNATPIIQKHGIDLILQKLKP